jgi:hypothetical protein
LATIRSSIVIGRDANYVFDKLSDPRSELKWNPQVQRMEQIDDGPIGVGSEFHAKWKMSKPLILTITRYERPSGWSYENGGPISVKLDISLNARGEETELKAAFDARPHGLARIAFPLFLLLMRREEKQNMLNAKRWLESSSAS